MRLLRVFLLVAIPSVCVACAAIWGFEDGTLAPPSSDGGKTDTTVVPDSGTPDVDIRTYVSDAAPPGCGDRKVSNDTGVFIHATAGQDDDACGTSIAPCRSLSKALSRVVTLSQSGKAIQTVYLASGQYVGTVTMPQGLPNGLVIQGAWAMFGEGASREWIRDCRDETASLSILKGSDTAAIRFETDAGAPGEPTVKLSILKVKSKDLAADGESLYGIFVRGASISFEDVRVDVSPGGDGKLGTPGAVGAAGAPAGCANAGNGGAGLPGDPGATPGGFVGADGFVPGLGGQGVVGENGRNGAAGGTGTCVTCTVSCGAACSIQPNVNTDRCGADGRTGCGGKGGEGGLGGSGGGASFGVYAWNARTTWLRTQVTTGGGGGGGPGGKGGTGGTGGVGAKGADDPGCFTACDGTGTVCINQVAAPGGSAGGVAGKGGVGGFGGGGAGGSTACVLVGPGSSTDGADGIKCKVGEAGKGQALPDGGPPGPSGKSAPVITTDGGVL